MQHLRSWIGTLLILPSALTAAHSHPMEPNPGEVTRTVQQVQDREDGPVKLALLVGINRYQHLPDLRGAKNDIEAMRELLVTSFGFPDDREHIRTLIDSEATREEILRAFREHLIGKADSNSIVVFHYSGHGSQAVDEDNDELDGYDETLVPHDSGRQGPENRDILDDELNRLLEVLIKRTPNVTVVLDSCFSGSAVRDAGPARVVAPDGARVGQPSKRTRSKSMGGDGPSGFRPANLKYALISGSADRERSYEIFKQGRFYGALTWHLVKQIRSAGADATYRDVMDVVRARVSAVFSSQNPQLEGVRADHFVFSQRSQAPEPYVLASPHRGRVRLQAGQVHGVTPGSTFDVYAPGTKEFESAAPSARIEIESVDVVESEARVIEGQVDRPASRAVERQHRFRDFSLRVCLKEALSISDGSGTLRKRLEEFEFVQIVSPAHGCHLSIRRDEGHFVIEGPDGSPLSPRIPMAQGDAASQASDRIEGLARWHRVVSIENPSSYLNIDLVITDPSRERVLSLPPEYQPERRLQANDTIRATVTNRSEEDVYFALLAASSDGSVSVLYPQDHPSERLAPGASWSHLLAASIPEGLESILDVLKVVATTQETDFSFLQRKPARGAGSLNPLQRLFADLSSGRIRGTGLVEVGDWTTAMRVLKVNKREAP